MIILLVVATSEICNDACDAMMRVMPLRPFRILQSSARADDNPAREKVKLFSFVSGRHQTQGIMKYVSPWHQ
jgi:hypothetical protein